MSHKERKQDKRKRVDNFPLPWRSLIVKYPSNFVPNKDTLNELKEEVGDYVMAIRTQVAITPLTLQNNNNIHKVMDILSKYSKPISHKKSMTAWSELDMETTKPNTPVRVLNAGTSSKKGKYFRLVHSQQSSRRTETDTSEPDFSNSRIYCPSAGNSVSSRSDDHDF